LLAELCRKARISSNDIYEVSVVGNTTMTHIFAGFPIQQLGHSPFKAWSVDPQDIEPVRLGVNINPAGNIHVTENIAGFVGADTVAVAVAVRMDKAEQMTLAIDIGTNGELVLGTKERMLAASCAAGPAFEGARISQGSRAVTGAIERVAYDPAAGDIEVQTIGDGKPFSICGSGLIDAIVVMVELGVVDATGRIVSRDDEGASVTPQIRERLIEKNGQPAFVIVQAHGKSPAIVLTQRDVREVQLAKAAIRAGIKLLQAKAGVDDSQIERYLWPGHSVTISTRSMRCVSACCRQCPLKRWSSWATRLPQGQSWCW
jgi:uncharacterized 2Fe-2S/4Fe-4S cluster protein (DUF4445 family)